ncbi:uncharacterized protein [Primulina eburnea]|uniref:uncharacterized protein n=1 Tax=Primulina eburnea TaxID=1245227 RepID=UPI003C6C08DC
MFAATARNLQKHSLKAISSLIFNQRILGSNGCTKFLPCSLNGSSGFSRVDDDFSFLVKRLNLVDGARGYSVKSMRSKVEKRMQRESGKTMREVRRAKKLRKKLMTDEERLIYNLRRAKKKVALLLQKLKKYELPELPPPRHDPELFTPEHLQAYKKIGFRNRNYVPVGVRGVFGGVVQNMHLHWKFHETVQVCCDNFPKERIKEMATMLARLSGGIVVNIHNVKTIIMFRGRNYRQPKNLIPINTLTKRKALFKARFEQALESQKLNIKKTEQDLRRKGVNPDDPVAMASIQRVASTFFNAIDKREGSPYIFREDKSTQIETDKLQQPQDPEDDSDQEELDRFIAEIEDAADKEWAAEEAAEKEELDRVRYWNRDDFSKFRRDDMIRGEHSEDENRVRTRNWNQTRRRTSVDSESEDDNDSKLDHEWDSNDDVNRDDGGEDSEEDLDKLPWSKLERQKDNKIGKANSKGFEGNKIGSRGRTNDTSMSEDMLSDLDDAMWGSDEGEEQNLTNSRASINNYQSSSDDENYDQFKIEDKRNSKRGLNRNSGELAEDHSKAKHLSPEVVEKSGDNSLSRLKMLYTPAKELSENEVTISTQLLGQLDALIPSGTSGQHRRKIGDGTEPKKKRMKADSDVSRLSPSMRNHLDNLANLKGEQVAARVPQEDAGKDEWFVVKVIHFDKETREIEVLDEEPGDE